MAKEVATGAASSEAGKGGSGKGTTEEKPGAGAKGGKGAADTGGNKGGKSIVMDDDGADDEVDDDATDDVDDDDDADDDAPPPKKGDKKSGGKAGEDGKGRKGAKAETGGKDGDTPKPPAKYDLELPKGSDHWLDAADLAAFKKDARSRGLTNDQAQTALDEFLERAETQSEAWYQEVAEDETYGGEHLAETERLARLALDKIEPKTTPEGKALRSILKKTGYGNRLEIVRFLAKTGKLMAEDSGAAGSGAGGAKSAGEQLYGKTTPADE